MERAIVVQIVALIGQQYKSVGQEFTASAWRDEAGISNAKQGESCRENTQRAELGPSISIRSALL